jgi:hypothetical protein
MQESLQMTDLLDRTELTARFKPGQSPLGHHWELYDTEENEIGRTKREYAGGAVKRQLWRTVTATGMDSGNDVRARVLDAAGEEIVHLHSVNVSSRDERRPHVIVTEPDGRLLGTAHHPEGDAVRIVDADERPVASLTIADRKDSPWQLLGASGEPIGIVDREVAKPVKGPSVLDYVVGINTVTDNASDFAATMFRGFLFSNVYSVALPELPPAGPHRKLTVLTPVLLGYEWRRRPTPTWSSSASSEVLRTADSIPQEDSPRSAGD